MLALQSRTVDLALVERHAAQAQIVREARRFNVLNCGRRFGKDILGLDVTIDMAIEGCPCAWFAPTYKNLTEDWRMLVRTLQSIIAHKDEQEMRLDLFGGGVIECWSLDRPNTARGRAYKRVVVNEAAQVPNLQEAWEQVIRPTLSDYRGDGWFLSTPRGFGYFKTLYDRGQDPLQLDWASWTFPTAANPFIAAAEIEAARRELPEKTFAQEYLAQFVADEAGVFRRLDVACVLEPQAPIAGHDYVVGCDWGKLNDYSVFSVVDVTTRQQVYLDRSNRIDYAVQVQRLRALCERYRPRAVISELNSIGQAVIEQLQAARLPVHGWTATQATKQAMIEYLALSLEQERIKLLRDPVQMAELQAYEAVRTASGLMHYSAPEGMHDDTVIGLGLGWLGARTGDGGRVRMREFQVVQ